MIKLPKNKKGFTIIEILIVLSIMAVLSVIVVSVFVSFGRHQALSKDNGLVIEVLRQAKSYTLDSKNSYAHGVHFNPNDVTLFITPTYSSSDSSNQVYKLNSDIIISNTSLNGGGSDVIFQKLIGSTNNYGTITLTSQSSGTSKIITIYKTGLIE